MATSIPPGHAEALIARATALGNQPSPGARARHTARRRPVMLIVLGVVAVGVGAGVAVRAAVSDRVAGTIAIVDDLPTPTIATTLPEAIPAVAAPATSEADTGTTAGTVAAPPPVPLAPLVPFGIEIEPDGLAHIRGTLPDAETAAEIRQSVAAVVGDAAIVEEFTIDQRADPVPAGSGLLTQTLLFPPSLAGLEPIHAEELEVVAMLLAGRPDLVVSIEGYTDDWGEDAQNIELSGARARRVAEYLVGRGVGRFQIIEAVGRGEADPRGDNLTEEGRALNRRVELHLAVAG